MLQWTSQRCPGARFLYKTDDDMVINPWKLKEVLRDNSQAELAGKNRFFLCKHVYLKKDK